MAKPIKKKDRPRYRTGADLLDLVVGGGQGMGYPSGKIINIVGDKSSGKTFLACELIAATHFSRKNLAWAYDDCESGFGFDTQALYGVEIMPEAVEDRRRSQTVEELVGNVREFLEGLKEGQPGIYVVDSLDGLASDELEERADERHKAFKKGEAFKKGSYQMAKAKFLSQEFFPPVSELLEQTDALLIIISQVRMDVDPRSWTKHTRAGGKAMDFYAHTVLWLTTRTVLKTRGRPTGVIVEAKATKSKTPRPFRQCYFTLLFTYGLDNTGTNVDFLYDGLTETGARKSKGTPMIWGGRERTLTNLKEFVKEHEMLSQLRKAIGSQPKRVAVIDWIENQEKLAQPYAELFGVEFKRRELIEYIESHGLEDKLTEKVVTEWEGIEDSIKSDRTPKYRQKPMSSRALGSPKSKSPPLSDDVLNSSTTDPPKKWL